MIMPVQKRSSIPLRLNGYMANYFQLAKNAGIQSEITSKYSTIAKGYILIWDINPPANLKGLLDYCGFMCPFLLDHITVLVVAFGPRGDIYK